MTSAGRFAAGPTPEGWLGLVRNVALDPWPGAVRWVLAVAAAAAFFGALWWGSCGGPSAPAMSPSACSVPIVLELWTFLRLAGSRICSHTSYDSYKLMAVFYAGLLPAICYWLRPNRRRVAVPLLGLGFLLGAELLTAHRFQTVMKNPPLIVDRDLADLGRVEGMPRVGSLNMRIPDMWSRLWASQFLLHRRQYFPTHTYEGHINTPLRGSWDMRGGLVTVNLPGADSVRINSQYSLVRVDSPWHIRAQVRRGWHETERHPRSNARWRWTSGNATLELDNPHATALPAVVRLDGRSLVSRDLQLWNGGRCLGTVRLGVERSDVAFPAVLIPPGRSTDRAALDHAARICARRHPPPRLLPLRHRDRGCRAPKRPIAQPP